LIGDGVNLFRDVFADAAEGVADVTIKATRASKKAAKKTRPSEKERKEHHIPGEGLYWEDAAMNVQNFRKQVKRDVEDKRDETLRQGVKKARAVNSFFLFLPFRPSLFIVLQLTFICVSRSNSSRNTSRKNSLPMLSTPSRNASRP